MLDNAVVDRFKAFKVVAMQIAENVLHQESLTCAHFEQREGGGAIEVVPHLGELFGQKFPKVGAKMGGGEKIALDALTCLVGGIVAVLRVILIFGQSCLRLKSVGGISDSLAPK